MPDEVIRLLTEIKKNLERRMAGIHVEMDSIDKRLDHIVGLLNIRDLEHRILAHDKAIADLTSRVEALEQALDKDD